MARKYAIFHTDRSVTDLCQSGAFWRGFAAGFAPELCLLKRKREILNTLENRDPLEYSWSLVGKILTEAITDCYGAETQPKSDTKAPAEREPAGEHEPDRGTVSGPTN
jgi:hypothetical protein